MTHKKILVVDDEQDLCDILLYNLRAAGYMAEAAYSAEEGMYQPWGQAPGACGINSNSISKIWKYE